MPRFADEWSLHPEAEALLSRLLADALARTPQAAAFARDLHAVCGVRLRDILDHLAVPTAEAEALHAAGWRPGPHGALVHAEGYFPDVSLGEGARTVAFRVEDLDLFLRRRGIDAAIEGAAFGPYRRARVFRGEGAAFQAVERSGWLGHELPQMSPAVIREARLTLQAFRTRRRQFDSVEAGLEHTEALVAARVDAIGPHWACDLFFRAEREYWMGRCDAGRVQKRRQDQAGVGWCNIDHHTYDSSREHFAATIRILERLGYECRELFYAGAQAGWGSQILEQPALRSTIFADIDLAPEELDIDFAHLPMAPLARHRRAGLWCAMHGESMLQAGLNHVAGMYDHIALGEQMRGEGVALMAPFSDMPHLHQALSEGQWWPIDPARIDALEAAGHLGATEAEDFRLNGAIAAHLENLERNDGYKGFNQPGIDGVLRVIDPRANLVGASG